MTAEPAARLFTEDEYLQMERAADHKSEYYAGRMYAMAGASEAHILAVGNTQSLLQQQFRGRPCRVYSTDMRVRVSETGLYTYPDVVAVCGEPAFLDDKRDTILNPNIIVEVLSPSTEQYDRTDKFEHYQSLESIREVLFVSQTRVRVEHYVRQDETWVLTVYTGPDDVIPLKSVGATLFVRDIYDKIELPPAMERPMLRESD